MSRYSLLEKGGFIKVRYSHKSKKLLVSTRIRSEGLFNEEKKQLNQGHPDYEKSQRIIDAIMEDIFTAVSKIKRAGFEPTTGMVRQELRKLREELKEPPGTDPDSGQRKEGEKKKDPGFFEEMDRYIETRRKVRTYSTYTNLNQTREMLKEFEKHEKWKITVQEFNPRRFDKLLGFMLEEKKYSDSTVDKHLRFLKAFMKSCYPHVDRSFMKFDMKKDQQIIFLTDNELKLLIEAELTGYQEITRDLFVFCCLTGMRYSDLAGFDPSWIQDGVFLFTQTKTGGIAMPPIFRGAQLILEKYNNTLPVVANPQLNRYLKTLMKNVLPPRIVEIMEYRGGKREVKRLPLADLVTTHTARKTFITLALSHGIPIQDVMKMSGHSDFRGMKPYIAVTREHIKDISKKWDV